MKYSNWKRTTRPVGSLFLDPANPRIPPSLKPLTEPQLIEELVLNDDVYGLARSIATNGFFPNEDLIIVREQNKLVVVEGNRRLAACKLLVNPQNAPVEFQGKFRSTSATFDQAVLKAIPIFIAPSRDAAVPLIIARHTATQIQRWEPFMQTRFYYTLVASGAPVSDIAAKFGLKVADIKNALVAHNLYQMACRLPLPQTVAEAIRNPRKFSLTTLTRVFETPNGRDFFGVQFDDDGTVRGKTHPDEFKKAFSKLATDVATEQADSRTLNSPADIAGYLNGFSPSEKPDLTIGGAFDSSTFLLGSPTASIGDAPKPKPKAKARKIPRGLIPTSISCNIKNTRVHNLFDELTRLSPEKFPNACAFAFRCFLELSVYCFLDSRGEIAKMTAEARNEIAQKNTRLPPGKPKLRLPPHWAPDLTPMLRRIADPNQNIISQAHITKALSKVITDQQELFGLNLAVHNVTYHPTAPHLRATWQNMEEFFKVLLA